MSDCNSTRNTNDSAADEAVSDHISVSDGDSSSSDLEILSSCERGEVLWRDVNKPIRRIRRLFELGFTNIKRLISVIFNIDESSLPEEELHLFHLLASLIDKPIARPRLKSVCSFARAINLIGSARKILVLTGAGISVSCGIPDFRSSDGIYSRLATEYPDLKSPQSMFDIEYFLTDPKPFFKFAKEIYPGQFSPSIAHRFIALLDSKGVLLRNYTQNIDTLEQEASIKNVIQCHGSFSTATCMTCRKKYDQDDIREDIFNQTIPRCNICLESGPPAEKKSSEVGDNFSGLDPHMQYKLANHRVLTLQSPAYSVIKPDIVFFGEDLPIEFHEALSQDIPKADLVIVMGSSLKVRPVACVPTVIPGNIPQILINREPLANMQFDMELYGNCDAVIGEILHRLEWKLPELKTTHGKVLPEFQPTALHEVSLKTVQNSFQASEDYQDTLKTEELAKSTEKPDDSDLEIISCDLKDKDTNISLDSFVDDNEDLLTWSVGKYLNRGIEFCRVDLHEYIFEDAELLMNLVPEDELEDLQQMWTEHEQEVEQQADSDDTQVFTVEDLEQKYMDEIIEKCRKDPILGVSYKRADSLESSSCSSSGEESDCIIEDEDLAKPNGAMKQDLDVSASKKARISHENRQSLVDKSLSVAEVTVVNLNGEKHED